MVKYEIQKERKGDPAMRKILALLLCCLLLATTVYAENAVSGVQSNATVSSDGSCQVSISMTIRLDEPVSELSLPLGAGVSSVRVNGSNAKLQRSGGVTSVNLTNLVKGVTGSVPITVNFTVNSAVTTDDEGKQTVTVPLLCSAAFPVEAMSFSVTMPDAFDTVPTFLSGYHEQDIESSISATVSGATVSGTVTAPLKDHETLSMQLEAPEGMFPQSRAMGGSLLFDAVAMGICGALALLYWAMTMSCLPRFPIRRSTAPEGVTAGVLGCYLARKGADLTMMVISWAQLGYLLIHLDENGRVFLYKKMEMGNERSGFERKTFQSLFHKGDRIDATGYRYARICEKTAVSSAKLTWGFQKGSGNPNILRFLGCGIGLFAGVAIGDCLTSAPAWRVILMLLMGFAGTFGSWYLQDGLQDLYLRGRWKLLASLACAAVFLIMGTAANCLPYAAAAVVSNALIGLLAAYTGRRTENGDRIRDEILGLRRYMGQVTKPELVRIMRTNPDYYYELAPYALALGVDKRFAKRFGTVHHPNCTWLVTDTGRAATASEWYLQLREAADAMNNLQKRPIWEKLLNIR